MSRKLAIAHALLFLAASFAGPRSAAAEHGGTFIPPSDSPPPGPPPAAPTPPAGPSTPGPSSPSGPSTPGPSSPGPSSPGPAPPSAGPPSAPPPSSPGPRAPTNPRGPAAAGNPGAGGGGGGAAGPSSSGPPSLASDPTQWQLWWLLNKAPYLQLRAKIRALDPRTGSDEYFLGHGQSEGEGLEPGVDAVLVRERIVPLLLRALENEKDNDILTGTLIALAKIGEDEDPEFDFGLREVLARYLDDSVQEVQETAAISLGILADPRALETLEHLALDDEIGRKISGRRSEVHYRTRSFAVFGMGLIGARSSIEVRRRVTRSLVALLEAPKASTRDVKVAALLSLGLVPILSEDEKGARRSIDPSRSCEEQIAYVLELLGNARKHHHQLRAHAPRTLGRLLQALGEQYGTNSELYGESREAIAKVCLQLIGKRSRSQPRELRQSATLALGQIGNSTGEAIDVEIRERLQHAMKDPDQQTKFYSLIALAQSASRAGPWTAKNGPYDQEALREVRKYLGGQLSHGKRSRPWAGIALGVAGHALKEDKLQPLSLDLSAALRVSLSGITNPTEVGAYAIAIGLRGDKEAVPVLLHKLEQLSDDEARGHLAVGLGLLGAKEAATPLREIVEGARYRPALLREGAIGLALLGDKATVPKLIEMLEEAKSLSSQASIAQALGFIGDTRSVAPLLRMLENQDLTAGARAFAAVALGNVASKEWLPWNVKITTDLNYRVSTLSMADGTGTGVLAIL